MITPQEARDLAVLGREKANDEYFEKAMKKIRWSAEAGNYTAYMYDYNSQLYPAAAKLMSMGFSVKIHCGRCHDGLEISWKNTNASWIHKVLTGG